MHGSVEDVREILQREGLPRPRAILSGLPLILLPAMERIVADAAAVLAPGGEFRTFSYLQSWPLRSARRLRSLLREHFAEFTTSPLELRNFVAEPGYRVVFEDLQRELTQLRTELGEETDPPPHAFGRRPLTTPARPAAKPAPNRL